MPQLDSGGGGAGGGDDLGAPDELLAFQDEGEEQDDKSRDSAAGPERDLAELKSSLVNESEGAAGGAGVPGAGTGARDEAEVGGEVSAGPCPAPLPRPPSPAPGRPRPALPGPRGTHPSDPSCPGPRAPRPSRLLWISPQALGREHASQRLFPDKLPESLEDGEFWPASPPPAKGPGRTGGPPRTGLGAPEGHPPRQIKEAAKPGRGEWGAGFPGAAGLESLPVP